MWPFCLGNAVDGFWEKKIGRPLASRSPAALELLHALIDNVMIRHSKSQRYLDGRPLLKIPSRTIEWRGFDITGSSEVYIQEYLAEFAASCVAKFLSRIERERDGSISFQKLARAPNFALVKSLVALMSKALSSPGTLTLLHLDHLRRVLLAADFGVILDEATKGKLGAIPLLPGMTALQILQSVGHVSAQCIQKLNVMW